MAPPTLVGSVDTIVRGIEHLQRLSDGGFGGLLFRAHEWATREQTLRSYELFARYVMPRFQGTTVTSARAPTSGARDNRKTIFSPNVEANPARLHRARSTGPGRVQAAHVGRARRGPGGRLAHPVLDRRDGFDVPRDRERVGVGEILEPADVPLMTTRISENASGPDGFTPVFRKRAI